VQALNNIIVAVVKKMPKNMVWVFSKKYIAGETLNEAVELVKKLNKKGILATMDVLGESVANRGEATAAKEEALRVFDAIEKHNLNANLSIKPTQMGLAIDEDFAYQQVKELVDRAERLNNFVRIDMEDSPFTDKTIRLFRRLRENSDKVGIVVQSYLKRTYKDVDELNKVNASYRLCKGIYVEPAEIAYKGRQEIRDNFVKILEKMFKDGNYVGIATHDEYLVQEAYRLIKEMNIPNDKFEFQMLYGVTENLRDKINNDGYMFLMVKTGINIL
jgi:proline dehydrogenase